MGVSLPVLICPDDMDFSCTVIVAKVIYTEDEVIWDRIGIVNRSNWNITEWRKSGIRNIGSWSVDDWNMYGDRFNLHDLWDSQWEGWISNNWKEEETRRLCDYVHQYFNKEENVDWFHNIPKLVFGKEEYQKCIEKFYERLCR